MDKELTEISPIDFEGTAVNTIKHATPEEAQAAAAAEKEQKQNYYIDPLEQEEAMKKRREELEAIKQRTNQFTPEEPEEKEEKPAVDESIRPDMNVTGYFSAGQTAKKEFFLKRPATKNTISLCMVLSAIGAIYSAFYLIMLIPGNFDIYWFTGWIYAVVVAISAVTLINGIRSRNAQNETLKKNALIGIICASISLVPLVAWLFHWLTQIF